MMQEFPSIEDIKVFLPKYLSEDDQKKLFEQLKNFPENIDKRMYSEILKTEKDVLQGDGIREIDWPPHQSGDSFQKIKALVLSNSCDISQENKRVYDSYCTFAPIFMLSKYESALIEDKHDGHKIANHLKDIREQRITPFFYIPSLQGLDGECFVRFDLVFSLPISEETVPTLVENRIFSLSNYGFYLLLFKYSIHTNRIQEKVQRG